MMYPDDFEERTGFAKIRGMALSYCVSDLGRELMQDARFSSDSPTLCFSLSLVDELCRFPGLTRLLDLELVPDVREPLHRCKAPGSMLSCQELLAVRIVCRIAGQVRKAVHAANEEEAAFPSLLRETNQLILPDELDALMNRYLDNEGGLKDNASPRLLDVRIRIKQGEREIAGRMDHLLKKAISDGIAESGTHLTLRNGRLVIPVVASHKRRLSGFIHDESSTGKTSYIEPAEVVEKNNNLTDLRYQEKREEERILKEITLLLQPDFPLILAGYQLLGRIDFNRAKALLAKRFDCALPVIKEGQGFHWIYARHPLLQIALEKEQKKLVPLEVKVDEEERILLISGPNAGGKSVAMMTVALLQYMLQCGFLVPASQFSHTAIFKHLLMDMGDDQSLESDLSTYSSHLINMKLFVKYAGEKSLVFIDEFGGGTEPAAGGAIAESVLEYLLQQGSYGVVTTHYGNLKHLATQTPGLANAAMLYDTGSMRPLFQMRQGMPGSSFAFEIAYRIGLPAEIVDVAKEKAGQEHYEYDKNLRKVLRDKRYWENKRDNIRILEKKLARQTLAYETEMKTWQKQRKALLNQAQREAEDIIRRANKTVENTIREIRENQADKEKSRIARANMQLQREQLMREQKITEDDHATPACMPVHKLPVQPTQVQDHPVSPTQDYKPGDKVRIQGQVGVGSVVAVKKGQATLEIGSIRTRVSLKRLEHASDQSYHAFNKAIKPTAKREIPQGKIEFKPQVDIRGKRVDEALKAVRELIDNGIMFQYNTLHILHGKGDGVLRTNIRDYLKTEAVVKSFRDEHEEFGGAGITVLTI